MSLRRCGQRVVVLASLARERCPKLRRASRLALQASA